MSEKADKILQNGSFAFPAGTAPVRSIRESTTDAEIYFQPRSNEQIRQTDATYQQSLLLLTRIASVPYGKSTAPSDKVF